MRAANLHGAKVRLRQPRYDRLGIRGQDVLQFTLCQPVGHLRLGQVVAPRSAAANFGLGDGSDFEARNQRQKVSRLIANFLKWRP